MSGSGVVKCALCGNEMPADTQYCPKCGSLNAHFRNAKSAEALSQPIALSSANPVSSPTPAPLERPVRLVPARRSEARVESLPEGRSGSQLNGADKRAISPDAPGLNLETAWQYVPLPSPVRPPALVGGSDSQHYWATPEPHVEEIGSLPSRQQRPTGNPNMELAGYRQDGAAPVQVRPRAVPSSRRSAPHNPGTAAGLEILGYIGVMGLGHMYGGRSNRGIILMFGWFVVLAMTIIPTVSNLTIGAVIGTMVIYLAGPLVSAVWIAMDLRSA